MRRLQCEKKKHAISQIAHTKIKRKLNEKKLDKKKLTMDGSRSTRSKAFNATVG
jgi:hypothetical protein